jgi:tRNA/tmRNA/rRNA uracil-C5-methylase (TrmA/RlmC/RlmD family)
VEESLNQKFKFLFNKLARWGSLVESVQTVLGKDRCGYREKTVLNARWDGHLWQFGMMVNDVIIPIPDCPVHAPIVNQTQKILSKIIPEKEIFPLAYFVQSSAQVVLIVKSRIPNDYKWLSEGIIDQLKDIGVEGLWVHYNPSAGRRLFEKTPFNLVFGKARSQDSEEFYYSSGAFQQLIPQLYNQSLEEVAKFFNPDNYSAVVDLYCGIGKSIHRWLERGSSVLGVEQNGKAFECANLNVPEATILRGACRQRIPQIKSWMVKMRADKKSFYLYANPPRTGIEKEVLEWIVKEGRPEKIAYLSCSAGTLSKNLTFLCENGYKVVKLIPYDFFPQTIHVECLALLEKSDLST